MRNTRWKRLKEGLDVLVSVCVVVTCGVAVWLAVSSTSASRPTANQRIDGQGVAQQLPGDPIALGESAFKGSPDASVVVVEYSEFQCPFCKRFADETLAQLAAQYIETGRVRWYFRHFPLRARHPHADAAAEAAECAGEQGQFWQMHRQLFAHQANLERANLERQARSLGLSFPQFSECMSGRMTGKVQQDLDSGTALGVTGTPTFFVGLRVDGNSVRVEDRVVGAVPLSRFQTVLDTVLDKATSAK